MSESIELEIVEGTQKFGKEPETEEAPGTGEAPGGEGDTKQKITGESAYSTDALKSIKTEAIYLGIVFFVALFLLAVCLKNTPLTIEDKSDDFLPVAWIYFYAGLLGGTVFGVKTFCRVVAVEDWKKDKMFWRYASPWTAACVALVVGFMICSGFIDALKDMVGAAGEKSSTGNAMEVSIATAVSVGFFAGCFADKALGKMRDISSVLFGHTESAK